MTEKPILFSAPMVRAILDGTKTQTRRVIKPPRSHQCNEPEWEEMSATTTEGHQTLGHSGRWWCSCCSSGETKCPYGNPGDHLWVRETWCPGYFSDGKPGYRADWFNPLPEVVAETKWKPSIHMPRWASRILLRVTDIRVERVQDITPADARAEGAAETNHVTVPNGSGRAWCGDIVAGFHELWDSINAKRGYSWESNPWCWCVEFEKVKP